MISERGSYYPIIRAIPGSLSDQDSNGISPDERYVFIEFGPVLLKKKHPVLREYLSRERSRLESILGSKPGPDFNRRLELLDRHRIVLRAMDFYREG